MAKVSKLGGDAVSPDETALRICRALQPLKALYDEHFDAGGAEPLVVRDPEVISHAVTELTDALLDLCGAPDDSARFKRDYLWDVVDEALPDRPSDEAFTRVLERVREALR